MFAPLSIFLSLLSTVKGSVVFKDFNIVFWLSNEMTRERNLEDVKWCSHINPMGQQESPTQCPTPTTGGRLDKSVSPRVGDFAQKGYPRPNYAGGGGGLDIMLTTLGYMLQLRELSWRFPFTLQTILKMKCFDFSSIKRALRPHLRTIIAT